jgi:hypothetical protein
VCPFMRLVLGARGDTRGDRRWPDPVWKSTLIGPLPRPLSLALSPVIVEVVMVQRKPKLVRSKPTLPPTSRPSIYTPRALTWGPKPIMWRCPRVTIRNRCAALGLTPST